MAEDNKKPEIKKPKFNAYWIYIGVFLLIVGFQFFGGSSWTQPNKTTQTQFEAVSYTHLTLPTKRIA